MLTRLVEKPVLLGQLCKLNPILSLEHNLPKICSSAVSKSPGEIQGISGTVENNTAPAGRGYTVAERGSFWPLFKTNQFQVAGLEDRQPICIKMSLI